MMIYVDKMVISTKTNEAAPKSAFYVSGNQIGAAGCLNTISVRFVVAEIGHTVLPVTTSAELLSSNLDSDVTFDLQANGVPVQ
jgi:hypothetical protein